MHGNGAHGGDAQTGVAHSGGAHGGAYRPRLPYENNYTADSNQRQEYQS